MRHRAIQRTGLVLAVGLHALGCLLLGTAAAERSGGGALLTTFNGSIAPKYLPRHRPVPVSLELEGSIRATDGSPTPRLSSIGIEFGASGGLETAGLPVCPRARLRNATSLQALQRCGSALVGNGTIVTEAPLSAEDPLLARARALAFNGRMGGRPAVWVHAYSTSPPVSFVLPFFIRTVRTGAYGIRLHAPLADALGPWPRLRSFRLLLGRRYRAHGVTRGYLNASCPLPPRFNTLSFPLAKVTYGFAERPSRAITIIRACRVRD